jgi:protein-disulfide isomerase
MDKSSRLHIPGAIIAGSIIVAGSIIFAGYDLGKTLRAPIQDTTSNRGADAKKDVDSAKVNAKGEPYIGKVDAPITIAYWFDYQCPFCQRNEEQTMPSLLKEYIDTGKAKFIFKDMQFLGPDSQFLGKVARAVWEAAPSQFYAWHKAIFDNQGQENTGWATRDKVLALTSDVLGSELANRIMSLVDKNSAIYQKAMDADKAEASSYGISSTPSFVIGKKLLVGALPYEQIKAAIEAK